MPADGHMQLDGQERMPMQLPAGVPLGAFLSFRDLRSVCLARLVADTSRRELALPIASQLVQLAIGTPPAVQFLAVPIFAVPILLPLY